MSGHTPGPWRIVEGFMGSEIESDNERDNKDPTQVFVLARDIGGRIHGETFDDYSERKANVCLIAAAPDLLKALEGLLDNERQSSFEFWLSNNRPSGDCDSVHSQWLESSEYHDFLDLYNTEIAAIARARGES